MLRYIIFIFLMAPLLSRSQSAGSNRPSVIISTRPVKLCLCCGPVDESRKPLFIIDGVVMANTAISTLDPANIISINVRQGADLLKTYGQQAANGVIEICLRKKELTATKPCEDANQVL